MRANSGRMVDTFLLIREMSRTLLTQQIYKGRVLFGEGKILEGVGFLERRRRWGDRESTSFSHFAGLDRLLTSTEFSSTASKHLGGSPCCVNVHRDLDIRSFSSTYPVQKGCNRLQT